MVKKKFSRKPKKEKDLLKPRKIKIRVIGVGGGASSILADIARGLKGVSFVAADTDQRSFKRLPSNVRVFQFGRDLTRGWGTGMNPELGEKAALEVKEKIKKLFEGFDLIILVSCLGGGVGSGASGVFASALREAKKLSLGIFTLPFKFEGDKKERVAGSCLEKIKDDLSGVMILNNENILKISEKKTSLRKSLSLMNQALVSYFGDLIETISQPGIINIDFADLRTILKGKGQLLCFGRGMKQGAARAEEALKEIFENPFFGQPQKVTKILFNVASGGELGLKEVEMVAGELSKLNPRARIIFGISKTPKLGKRIKISLLALGEDSPEGRPLEAEEVKAKKPAKAKEKARKKKKAVFPKRKVSGSGKKRKSKVRRSALEAKKAKEEEAEKEWWQEPELEIPAFLRSRMK